MRKKVRLVGLAVTAVTVVVLVVGVTLGRRSVPRYHGRLLRDCIREGYASTNARAAVLACGTNAIPYYLNLLRSELDSNGHHRVPRTDLAMAEKLQYGLLGFLERHDLPNLGLAPRYELVTDEVVGCLGLSMLGPDARSAAPALAKMLSSEPLPRIPVNFAGEALTCMGVDGVRALTNLFGSPDARVRRAAASFAGNYATTNTHLNIAMNFFVESRPRTKEDLDSAAVILVPALLSRLSDTDDDVKFVSTESLRLLKRSPELVVPRLMGLIQNTNECTRPRVGAIRAIAAYDSEAKAAIPVLFEALRGRSNSVAVAAGKVLMAMDRNIVTEVVTRFTAVIRDGGPGNDEARIGAIGALAECGSSAKAAFPVLFGVLREHNCDVALAAAEALMTLDQGTVPQVVPRLVELISDGRQDDYDRINVIELIEKQNAKAAYAVPALMAVFHGNNAELSKAAAEALIEVNPVSAAAAGVDVSSIFSDPDVSGADKISVIRAFGEMGKREKRCVPQLVAALDDADPAVRHEAATTLRKVAPKAIPKGFSD